MNPERILAPNTSRDTLVSAPPVDLAICRVLSLEDTSRYAVDHMKKPETTAVRRRHASQDLILGELNLHKESAMMSLPSNLPLMEDRLMNGYGITSQDPIYAGPGILVLFCSPEYI